MTTPKLRDILTDSGWADAIQMELKVAAIQEEQERNGWLLDKELCEGYIKQLEDIMAKLDAGILNGIPPRVGQEKTSIRELDGRLFNKDGSPYAAATTYWGGDYPPEVKGAYSRISFIPFDLNSTTQVKEFLLNLGWKPLEWNYNDEGTRTSPKLTEESLEALEGGIGGLISERFTVVHRLRLLRGVLKAVREDGRVEAQANTIGTNTSRFTHKIIVNIPKADDKVYFGKQCRAVFTVGRGRKLVGCDAKGLEGRIMAHYANDPELTEILLSGDVHTRIWNSCKDYVSSRNLSKTIFYAFLYGASDTKLGWTADIKPKGMTDAQVGTIIRARILQTFKALNALVDRVQREAKKGFLYGLDGRKVPVRSSHSALNALLQSAGAILMKVALCFAYNQIKKENLDALIVGNFHDEWQLDCDEKDAERVAELCSKAIVKAGEFFKLNCPMDGDAKTGQNWAQTH